VKIRFITSIIGLFIWQIQFVCAQTLRDYIDGAKVAVDVIKLSKEGKVQKDSTKVVGSPEVECITNYGDVCFENNLLATVEIDFYVKGSISDTVSLIIPKASKDCTYQVPANIYEYQIVHISSLAVITKGQLKVEKCDNLEIIIK
jgi:hypothetical protein